MITTTNRIVRSFPVREVHAAASRLIPIPAHVAVDYLAPGLPFQYRIVMHGNATSYMPAPPYVWPPMKSQSVH